jgi:hypothetical protein
VRELTDVVVDAFRTAAADPDVAALHRELPSRLVEMIADRATRCAGIIDTHPAPQ